MSNLLEARNLTKIFGGGLFAKNRTVAVDDVSFQIKSGSPSITAIAGESGSGKSTLAQLLLGIHKPTKGEVFYRGQDIAQVSGREKKQFRREVQSIFQDPFEVYNPFYKVDHVLTTPISKFGLAKSKAEATDIIEKGLSTVGLRPAETLGRYPHQLSGGQRQRLMIARALILNPSIIVADEPVSMVDASLRATILEDLRKVHRDYGISLIYITHDLTTAYQFCENIMILYQGSVVEAGNVEKVIKNPKHPYTQLLVDSIPHPNPKKKWVTQKKAIGKTSSETIAQTTLVGCKFLDRCPKVMDICQSKHPPTYLKDIDQTVSCYLHNDYKEITSQDLAEIISTGKGKK